MPKALKDQVAQKLNQTAKELYDIDNFSDLIGDEPITENPDELLAFLTEKNHPVLELEPLL
jgi:acetyl-CoA synthase